MLASDAISSELKKLGKHSTHYALGLVGSLLLGFVSFPIFTRAFSATDYGLISLTQKIFTLAIAVSKMGLQNSVLRFFDGAKFEADREAAARYYSTIFFGAAGAAAIATALFAAGLKAAPSWIVDASLGALLLLASVLIFLGALESILWSFFRMEERTKMFNFFKVGIRAATIAAVCMLLPVAGKFARTYFYGAIAVEASATVILTAMLVRRGLLWPIRFDFSLYRAATAFGAPLVAYEIAATVLDSGDRYLVLQFLGGDALGLYSVAYSLSQYLNDFLILPLNLALLPIYMRLWTSAGAEKTAEFLSTGLDYFFMAAFGIFTLAVITARDGVLLLASSKYHGAERLIPLLVGGLLIFTTHIFLSAGLLIHKNTKTMARILLISAAFNMLLNVLLLPRIGLFGAAIATLASYLACVCMLAQASFRVLRLEVRLGSFLKYAAAAGLTCALIYRLDFGNRALNLFGKAALAALSYLLFLYLSDARIRALPSILVGYFRQRSGSAAPVSEPVSQ